MPLPWILLRAPSAARLSRLLSICVLRVVERHKKEVVKGKEEDGLRSDIKFLDVTARKQEGIERPMLPLAMAFSSRRHQVKIKLKGQGEALLNDTCRMLGRLRYLL